MHPHDSSVQALRSRQAGMSLLMVMMVLVIVGFLGVSAMRIAMTGERGARNDRDLQVATQAAEAALLDAEYDIFGPGVSQRRSVFGDKPDLSVFLAGCGDSGQAKGLCLADPGAPPSWLSVDLASGRAALFGEFTGRQFQAGGPGVTPARPPVYVIEPVPDPASRDLSSGSLKYVYRVTAMGFGPRANTQAVVQMLFRS